MTKQQRKFRSYTPYVPEAEIVEIPQSLVVGYEQGSYFAGFAQSLKNVGITGEDLTSLILAKLNSEYTQEIMRMRFQTEERIAELYSMKIENSFED